MSPSNNIIRRVTALILTHNRRDDLKVCLESIERQDFPSLQVVVVDNNSTDGTATMIRENYRWIDYVGLDENQGIAARNIGAREAEGDLILSLDDDSELPCTNTVSRIVEKFEENPDLGVASFRIIDDDGDEDRWFRWEKEGSLRRGFRSPTFVGCGAAIRPEMFERIGGYWEPYFMHLEERDFSLRILDSGSEVRYFPTISVLHHDRQARRQDARFIYYVTRNTFWYIWRNFPFWIALFRSIVELFKLGTASLKKGGFGLYLKGLWDVRSRFPDVLETRNPVDRKWIGWISGHFEEEARE